MLDMFETIMSKFVSVNYHMNNHACMRNGRKLPARALEVTLVNKKLIKKNSESKSFSLHKLNHPNRSGSDCQVL